MSNFVLNNEPFLLPGGSTGCLLLHGFTSMPEEMRPLGEYLTSKGDTVLGARMAGHGTQPDDLRRVRWIDWLGDVQDGLSTLSKVCSQQVLIDQSLGGMLAPVGAAGFKVSALVTLSAQYSTPPVESLIVWLLRLTHPMIRKKVPHYPPDHPLYHRHKLNYPACPEFPSRILLELDQLASAMVKELSIVTAPVLMIHSREDHDVPFSSMQSIYAHLGSQVKEMHPVEGMNHSLVMDPRRNEIFELIQDFLAKLGMDG